MKPLFILPLLIVAGLQLKAQQQIIFKPAFLPKTSYSITKEMKTNMNMGMPAALAAAGGGQDMVMAMSSNSTSLFVTGTRDKNNMIPVKITSKTNNIKMTMNGQDMPMGSGMPNTTVEVYGKYTPAGQLQVDSVAGQKINDSVRTVVSKMIETIQNGIKFPDHPLKVGDVFVQEMPFNIPLPGATDANKATVKVTYKLTGIANNIATFDLVENIDVDMDQAVQSQKLKMNISGMGNGSLNYDVTKQFFTTMTTNLNLTFDMNMSGMNIKGKSVVSSVDKVEITAN